MLEAGNAAKWVWDSAKGHEVGENGDEILSNGNLGNENEMKVLWVSFCIIESGADYID